MKCLLSFCKGAQESRTKCIRKDKHFNPGGSNRCNTGGQAEPGKHKQAGSRPKTKKTKVPNKHNKSQIRKNP